jgi:hypothetical protein
MVFQVVGKSSFSRIDTSWRCFTNAQCYSYNCEGSLANNQK